VLTLLSATLLGYLLGSIPSAAWVARWRGVRIFDVGSGNMGAMNTARNLGVAAGIIVLLADVGKGAAATAIALAMARVALPAETHLPVALAAGAAAVIGHTASLFVGGRGGKGLATILGISLPLYPAGGALGLLLLIALTLLTRRPNAAAVAALLAYPWVVALAASAGGATQESVFWLFTGTIPVVIASLLRHRPRRR
jgi:acyl phosphate:glycerol-3-phosphate acyltransferase